MYTLKTFIIFFFSIALIASSVSSKSHSMCQQMSTLNKSVSQDIVSHEDCNQKKKKILFSLCIECECNLNQVELIELSQSFEIDLENKIIISNNKSAFHFNPNNLDPPPKTFL